MLEKIQNLLRDHKGDNSLAVTPETSFADLKLDSLEMAELVMELEDEFSVTLETDNSIQTVGDMMKMIEAKLS